MKVVDLEFSAGPKTKEIQELIDRLIRLIESENPKDSSLSWGKCGQILFYMYYGHFSQDEVYYNKGLDLIYEVFEDIGSEQPTMTSFSLFYGISGFLGVLALLKKQAILDIDFDDFRFLEQSAFDWAISAVKEKNTDFIVGAMGIMPYVLTKATINKKENKEDPFLDNFCLDLIGELKLLFKDSSRYKSILINEQYNKLDNKTKSHMNFGLAHGMSSIMLSLITLYENGIQQESIKKILDDFIETIFKLREIKSPPFPHFFINSLDIDTNIAQFQLRLGWCHSDLNLIHILAKYQQVVSPNDTIKGIIHEALEITTQRTAFDTNRLEDPFICHGYSGVAQYYFQLFHLTGDLSCKSASDFYLHKTLDYYSNHEDDFFFSEAFNEIHDNLSFLYGNVGVGLALTTYLYPDSRSWSEIILV